MKHLFWLFFLLFFSISQVQAQSAHVHGEAEIRLGWDEKKLQVAFFTAAVNLFGFETSPKTKAQKNLVRQIEEKFRQQEFIPLASKLGCKLAELEIENALLEKSDEHHHGHNHDHGHDHEKGHEDQNFEVVYEFSCADLSSFESLDFAKLLEEFPAIHELQVEWVNQREQSMKSLTPSSSRIQFAD